MRDEILAQPQQISDALWRCEAARLPREDRAGGLMVCGVGGSAVGSDLAAAAIGRRATRPLRTVRAYAPDSWLTPDTLVLCSSYSGNTEETLACFEAAGEVGAPRVALTTGGKLAERAREEDVPVIGAPSGMQPRASVIYMTVAVLECAAACGAAPPLRQEVEGAAEVLSALASDPSEAEEIAASLEGTVPVVHGAESTAAVARRWKGQINENAEMAAFASELPEANHNEIEGWARGRELAPLAAVFLRTADQHPRVEGRLDLTAEVLDRLGAPVVQAHARGDTSVSQVLSLVMLGDLVSVELADRTGVDSAAMEAIEGFKRELGG